MTPKEKAPPQAPLPTLTPLAQGVMESFGSGVVIIDPYGRVVYANGHARRAAGIDVETGARADALRPRLVALGARVSPLRVGGANLGEALFLPSADQARTLAERERQAIVDTLQGTKGRLAETARRLGISRTTLWRRLRAYGIHAGNGRPGVPHS